MSTLATDILMSESLSLSIFTVEPDRKPPSRLRQLGFPDGSMSAGALRRLAASGKLAHEKIAGNTSSPWRRSRK
jgi:hypothetical protein